MLLFGIRSSFFCRKIVKNMDTIYSSQTFSGSDWDERKCVWYFADYAAGVCLSLLEGVMRHAQIPNQLKPTYEEAVFALHYILDNQQEEKEANQETCARVLFGLHHFALCLPFLKAEYIAVDDEDYAQTNLLIAKRILPVLKNFAERTQCPPSYFNRIYTDFKDQCAHWDAALQEMIFAFEYLAEPAKYHGEKAIRRMQIGLHLFAEYLQEMYN